MKLSSTRSFFFPAACLFVLFPLSAVSAASPAPVPIPDGAAPQVQESSIAGFGPLDPDKPSGALTPEQIIQKFGEREAVFAKARESYTFRQEVKVDTIDDDSDKVDGEYRQVTDIVFDKDGRREEHVVFAPQNTLQRVMMSPADMADIERRLPFILTTPELPQYDITYLGRQKVDDLDTYVFSVKPKVIEKNKRYYQGKIWVDQQDFEIVLVNGKSVPDDVRRGHEDLSPPFTTYYEQVDGKYWFPTYTKAEGTLHFAAGTGAMAQNVHMRSTVRYTDYKQFHATSRIIFDGEDITNNNPDKQTAPAGSTPTAPPASTPASSGSKQTPQQQSTPNSQQPLDAPPPPRKLPQ